MGKKVILAVAGSGKTSHIINGLSLDRRSLILTYTNNNIENIRQKIIAKFGYLPTNIRVLPYFTFLYSFCYRPLLSINFSSKGISYAQPPIGIRKTDPAFFRDRGGRLYSNRIAGLLQDSNAMPAISSRVVKYFDDLIIDEVQDLGGRDFNFLLTLAKRLPNVLLVGDFYQHTFNTSWDGNVNKSLYDNSMDYQLKFQKAGFEIDDETLIRSYRCSPSVCSFITERLKISMESHRKTGTKITFVSESSVAKEIFDDVSVIKLFYQKHYLFKCNSRNWGDCKGEDKYHNVCIALNESTRKLFDKNRLDLLAPLTRNKLYVALSRANGDIYFVTEELLKSF